MKSNMEEIPRCDIHVSEEKYADKSPFANALTALAFACGVCALPVLGVCYGLSKITKKVWMKILSKNFPNLIFVETDSIRTLLDTHRNQGVINMLLTIKGVCNQTIIKQTFHDHMVDKRDKQGDLMFPILRLRLLSCWGNYAWAITEDFDFDNHIVVGNSKYRGRPLNDDNLQDYVSSITSKFLLNNQPPWHITVIPNIVSNEPAYGILIRVHHLILEEGSLNMGDFTCLKPESEFTTNPGEFSRSEEYDTTSPLSGVVKTPKAISELRNRLSDSLANHWNEFIADFDPITSPELLKKSIGFFECVAITFITLVSTYKNIRKYLEVSEHSTRVLSYATKAFDYERKKRKLTMSTFALSIVITFNPASFLFSLAKFLWWINVKCFINAPLQVYQEFLALRSCIKHEFCLYPNTTIGMLYDYLPLFYEAGKETCYIASIIYSAPASIVYEMFFTNKNSEEHHLQKTSSCGRKVIAWSEPVSRKHIKQIANRENLTETEILLSMISPCIKEYFHHAHLPIPNTVSTAIKMISYDKLLSTFEQKSDCDNSKGTVFFTLPMNRMCLGVCKGDVKSVSEELTRVKTSQAALYFLTSWQNYLTEMIPSVYSRIFLNYTSKKFCVSILEIKEGKYNTHGEYRKTLWDDTVAGIFYWRPPQSNTGMSLTIQRYADTVRLNVMTDSLLSPNHKAPARYWMRAARKLLGCNHDEHHPSTSQENENNLQDRAHAQIETQESLESQKQENESSGDNDSDTREQGGFQEMSGSSDNSTNISSSPENRPSPTTYMYDYLLNSEYRLDDFIRDVQFEDEEQLHS